MGIIKPLGAIERSLRKDQVVALAEANVQEVIDSGKYDMLKVFTELKRYELYLKTVIEKAKDAALDMALEQGEKSLEVDNAKITIYKRTVYDFSNDQKWSSLKGDLDYLTDLRKQREALLKELEPGEVREVVDEKTGEVEEVVAPIADTKLGLIVKL
jgi:hypothetical protein